MKNTVKKATALLMGVMMTLSSISFPVSVKADGNLTLSGSEETTATETETAGYEYSYADYLYDDTKTDDLGDETVEITIDYENLISLGEDASLVTANGRDHVISYTKDGGSAEFSVTVEKTGFYHIAAVYAQTEDTNRTISVGLMIDGEYPFTEAADMELPRVYEDNGEIRVDSDGNESAPKQIQVLDWQTESFHNTNGYYEGDYYFYFTEGTHTITLYGNEIVFLLDQIILYTEEETPSYAEYMEQTQGEDSSDVLVVIQAEKAKEKSASTLYPSYDRTNAATQDQNGDANDPEHIKINIIGGSLWDTSGEWISWEFEVPEDGYYNIGIKFRQNFLDGMFTSRDIYIDGEILFEDLQGVKFQYDDEWQTMTLTDENGEELKIYLTAGTHEIKMECTMGDMTDILRELNDMVSEINELYRRIIMITSTDPDSYTDYFLTDRLPDMLDIMQECRDTLVEQIDNIVAVTGGMGSNTAILDTLRVQLDLFLEDPEEITDRLSTFKDNISAVGSWLVNIQDQGLELDYIYIKSPDVDAPKNNVGFFKNISYSVRRFLASFGSSDTSISGSTDGETSRSITVWISTGRDQAQVLEDLINESFTPETGISVELELVSGSLLNAMLAGEGPDVAIMLEETEPVNYAIRGALQDLTVFEDFEEVASRFYDSAMEPFWYEGGCYAIPDTQVFYMMFYRTDVFEDLGIEAPETWEEFYDILPVIQRNNLQITVQDIFTTLLYQNGGSYYNEDGSLCLLDSQEAIEAMTTYTDLYTNYGFEVKTDFYSRFRSGELVLSIQPYNMYNQLVAAAPEISGLWEMVPIPGTVQEDGSIDRSQNSTVTGTVMLADSDDKEAAWEFIKWWTSDEVKASYGIGLEALMGESARFTPANIGTMELLPWSNSELNSLLEAMESVVGIPQVPGSYYTSRGLTNAFRTIVYSGEFPSSVMKLQTKYINEEITRKREEFGLSVYEGE